LNKQFSFIILTYNEAIHLPRLLHSIIGLNASIFVLDSGSSDDTVKIAENHGCVVLVNAFENHPKQWDFGLRNFKVETPWVICLDADQVVTPELKQLLLSFNTNDYKNVNGIYFNRKNYFKGKWIKHGGYYPFYLLKMIRFDSGYSDLNENMDHRFIVPGATKIWEKGYLIEENLKENNIKFWIDKHNRYSDQVAQEEVERRLNLRVQTLRPDFMGSPDEHRAYLKKLWWRMPLFLRPFLYFTYRMVFQLGILDGREGIIFHFLQGFWFRLIVDIKVDEILNDNKRRNLNMALKFLLTFLFFFLFFYYFNIMFYGLTTPGGHYYAFVARYLNYIQALRWVLLNVSVFLLDLAGYSAVCNNYNLLVAGHGSIQLVYSCLGLGVISFFSAVVIAYPKPVRAKIIFFMAGLCCIEILNVLRFMLIALFWTDEDNKIIDHHTIFNLIIYIIVALGLFFWLKNNTKSQINHESN
jgi:exosortase/archaeosortase family protein